MSFPHDIQFAPNHLYVELTDRCNLKCKHCYLAASPDGGKIIDGKLVSKAVCDFARMGGASVAFSGGEPLLHPEWKSCVEHAGQAGLRCTLVTNGLLLDREATLFLLNCGADIAISLDGSREETHDAIRGPGTFVKAMGALDRIAALGAQDRAIVCFTPTRTNLHELGLLVRTLHQAGFRNMHLSLLENRGRLHSNFSELSLGLKDRVALLTELAFIIGDPKLGFNLDTGILNHFYYRLFEEWDGSGDPVDGTLRLTAGGELFLTAYTDDEKFRLGNVNETSIDQCCYSDRAGSLLSEAWKRLADLPDQCGDCPYWIVCGGGSPARAQVAHRDLTQPDDYCEAKSVFLDSWYSAV